MLFIGLLLSIGTLIIVIKTRALSDFLTLEYIKSHQAGWSAYYQAHPLTFSALYFFTYVTVTALSIPLAVVMTLVGGAIFGLTKGVLIISFASTTGATLAFLLARTLLHDFVQKRYGKKLKVFNEGIQKEGAFYLFALRLVPVFPFFIINFVMGLTPISTLTFFFFSQLGMLPGTIAYVNAGTELGKLESLSGIVSWRMLLAFGILGLLPLLSQWILRVLRKRG